MNQRTDDPSDNQGESAQAYSDGVRMADARRVLEHTFGHAGFREPQESIIRHVLGRQHALVMMPTGMGKSL